MILRERLLLALQDGAKTNNELRVLIPDKSMRIISATISLNKKYFVRLEKGYVGLCNRDEHLITGKPINYGKFCLYKKICNLLTSKERRNSELYDLLPGEKKVSIRATINMHPHLFIRITRGIVGRAGRDEYLIEKYAMAKRSTQVTRIRGLTITERLIYILLDGEKSIQEIHHLIPEYPRKSITSKLSLNGKFEKVGDGKWRLKRK